MKKSRNMKERIFALLLALTMITGLMPQNMMVAKAADNVEVEIQVVDSKDNTSLSQFDMSLQKKESQLEPIRIDEEDKDPTSGKYLVTLEEGATYSYTVKTDKNGYTEKTDEFTVNKTTDAVSIKMEQNNIAVEPSTLDLKVGQDETLVVTNPISGLTYRWSSDNSEITTVDNNGNVKAVKAGETTINVSGKNKTTQIPVKVTKYDTSVQLTIEPESGMDKSEVKLTAEVEEGNKPVDEGSATFSLNGVVIGSSEVNSGKAEYTHKLSDGEYLSGQVKFKVTYSGTDKFAESSKEVEKTYASTSDITVSAEDLTDNSIVFDPEQTTQFQLKVENDQGRDLEYLSLDSNVAEVSNIGVVTVKEPGDIAIQVTAKATDGYNTSVVTFTGVAQQKLTLADLDWQSAPNVSKVYDQTADIEIEVGIPEGKQVNNNAVTYTFSGKFSNPDVGQNKDITISGSKPVSTDGNACYYNLDMSEEYQVTGKGAVTAREVKLSITKDVTLSYGQNLKTVVEAGTYAAVTDLVSAEKVEENRGFFENEAQYYDFAATLKALAPDQEYYVGTYTGAVIPGTVEYEKGNASDNGIVTTAGVEVGNYKFVQDVVKDLIVERQKLSDGDILNAIEWGEINSTTLGLDNQGNKVTEDAVIDKIYAKNSSTLQLLIKKSSALSGYYDQVLIQLPGSQAFESAQNGITLPADMPEGLLSGVKICLSNSASDDTYTENSNRVKGNNFDHIYIDNSAPEVEFDGDLKETALSVMTGNITFGFFQNAAFTQSITVTEKPDGDDKVGFDPGDVEYYVWKLSTDEGKSDYTSVIAEDLAADTVRNKIDGLTEDDWTAVVDYQIPFSGDKEAIEEGYYVLFVRVTDRIDNGEVYASNGMVFDVQAPVVTVTGCDQDLYNEDVEYSVNIQDPIDSTSAISKLEVTVTKTESGKQAETPDATSETYDKDVEKTYVDSYTIDFSQDDYELNELGDWQSLTVKGKVTANKNVSTDVKLEIKAYDNAGNCDEDSVVIKEFQIDKKAPEINVSFNNNGVRNDIYFKDARVMTISYTERNLDVDDLSFDISLDGVTYDDQTLDEMIRLVEEYGKGYILSVVSGTADNPLEVENVNTDKMTSVLKLRFDHDKAQGEDARFSIVPSCVDKAENENEIPVKYAQETEAGESFVIDKKEPTVSEVTYKNETGSVEPKNSLLPDDEKEYSQSAVEATVKINEKNFRLDNGEFSSENTQFDFSATSGTDSADQVVTISDYLAAANKGGDWTQNNSVWTSKVEMFMFDTDANYSFGFKYYDLAGNEAIYDPHYFTVDKTAPDGDIELDSSRDIGLAEFLNMITFNIFKKTTYDIGLTGSDATSGVASIEYIYPENSFSTEEEMKQATGWTTCVTGNPEGVNSVLSGNFSVGPNRQFVVYEKITDYAGNVTYRYPSNGIVADNELPQISITELNAGDARNGIYNEDIHLRITAEDPIAGDTYSGLEHVWYKVTVAGNTSYSETIHLLDLRENDAEKYQSPEKRTFTRDITIPASENYNSNDIKVQAFVTDFSQNTEESDVMSLKMDITDPTIDVTYDLNSPLNERYYNATRTATVTVTERNFDPSAVRFNITNTDGTQPSISGWSHSSNSGVSDSATHTCTVTFAADGDYTFTLNTTDLAGNDSNYTRVDEFTIDQTDPTIQVSYDNNNDAEPGYFNADRTATITVTEHNFNAAEVNTAITASLEGRGVSTPGLGGWSTRGDVHTASVTFSADADYTFDVDYTDLAGNAAADYEQDSFTVDQTAPELEFFDIEDKSANNDVVAPGVRYSDNNYTENGVEITLEGANHGEMALDGDRSSIPNGESIKMADFERTKENDDLYTMTAVITDRAGNETEDSVIFSVNRFGSVFVLSDDTQELVDKYYTNEEQDLVVTEINVDSLVFNGISYGRDGELVDLEAGTDYEVKASGSEVSWKQYDYTINKENFEKEGNYTVTIDSEDRATNVGNSRAKGCDIEFAIDKTAPTVVITGIENGEQYRANTRDITVNAADNIAMGDVGVYVGNNDEPAQTFDAKDIQAAGGELTYTMNSSNSRQDIKAVATDAAGNTAEAEITRVLLTSNLFVQFYSNTPLLVGTIVGVVVIAGGLLWFFLIFKRKKDEEQANK
ncbi:MAG TPA: Ig-like domain-containing protein [Candidatus Mediterraneibacter faecipullorum]|uniref:Ig-like domain-containing protein n=1 Tax=Candidatus Mediterraneibacter faecipullorum TaxID=2838670 RepID=A0A9D2NN27_9FIRM|nr:Ig-like domain-containing protein [Candidatus Mediterraneibacter faecipullorum]